MGVRADLVGTWREDGVVAAFTLALCALLGAPVGLLWSALAPHADVVISAATAEAASTASFADRSTATGTATVSPGLIVTSAGADTLRIEPSIDIVIRPLIGVTR